MPAWAVIAVSRWETVLDELASGSAALEQKLDWAIKRTLYLGHALRRGFAPEAIAAWNRVLDAVAHPNPASFTDDDAAHEALCRALFSSNGLRREANSRQRTLAAELGLEMKRLPDFLQLRQELCELEVRFGQLGPLGIFRALDEAGCLEHRIPEVSAAAIAGAVTEPPPSGRARVRADFIRAHAGQSDHFCEWSVLWKRPGKMQDLSDPFISEAPPWEDCPTELQDSGSIIGSEILSETQEEYDRGHYQRASELLTMATQFLPHWRGGTRARYHQLVAWVQCRRGFLREALTAADHLARLENLSLSLITDYICIHRFGGGLAPGSPEFWQWVQRGEELLARRSGAGSAATLKAHRGYVLARAGRLAEARADLEAGCQEEGASRVLARSMADLGDVCRMMGEVRAARRHLEKAEQIQRSQHFLGDLADHTLTHQAKLEKDSRRAAKLLRAARLIQSRWKNNLSLARTVLLEARICPSIWQNHRRRKCLTTLQSQVPALQHCPLLNRILTNWNVWCDGGVVMDSVDFFAGL